MHEIVIFQWFWKIKAKKSNVIKNVAFFTLLRISAENLLGGKQFVSLGFFVGSAVGMDGSSLDRFVEAAAELAGEFGGGSITGGNGSAEFLFNGFEFADAGTVAEVSLFAGSQTFDGRFGMGHDLHSLN